MVFVTLNEYEEIKKKIPGVRMTITSKQKKSNRKKRWIEEDERVMKELERIRNS